MSEPTRSRFQSWLLAVIGFIVIAAAIGFAVLASLRPPGKSSRPPVVIEEPTDAEDPQARAVRLAVVDSSQKTAWVDEIPGLDVSMLSPDQHERLIRFANAQSCTCGCGFTLAACRRYDSQCDVSLPRVERLRDSIVTGAYTRR